MPRIFICVMDWNNIINFYLEMFLFSFACEYDTLRFFAENVKPIRFDQFDKLLALF